MKLPYRRSVKAKKTNLFAAAATRTLEIEIQAAWAERDMEKCVQLLRKVLEINPRSPEAWLTLGRAHGMQFQYDEAIESLEKAVEVSPKNERVSALLKAGTMARNFYDHTIAESFFIEAVEISKTIPAKLALAEYSLRIRKPDVSRALVDEVIASAPEDPGASFLWCRLHEDCVGESVDRLERLVDSQSAQLKAKAGYQLAKMLDLAGDYHGAMRALVTAKTLQMPERDLIVRNRETIRAKLMLLARGFSTARRKQWQAGAHEMGSLRRLALLGGHPRSGTTLLEQVLDSHPDIVSAEETDNFFAFSLAPLMRAHLPLIEELQVMDAASSEDLLRAREGYFTAMDRCLGEPVGSKLLIDKNPSLTALIPAIFRIFPETKFLTMIRDPRDVVLSCYMQPFVPVSSISGNFLTLEDTAAEFGGLMGIWNEIVERFDGNVFEVRYEDMVEDIEGNARKVLDFLGMQWSESVMAYDRHAREKVVRSPTSVAVTEKVHTRAIARWKNYEKYLEPVYESLSPSLKALGYE